MADPEHCNNNGKKHIFLSCCKIHFQIPTKIEEGQKNFMSWFHLYKVFGFKYNKPNTFNFLYGKVNFTNKIVYTQDETPFEKGVFSSLVEKS